jgi:hypothetical protein
MKNVVFWDVSRVALVRTDVSEKLSTSIIRMTRKSEYFVFLRSVRLLLVTANIPSSPILMMEALSSSETSILIRATRRNSPEDDVLHSLRRENLKYYKRDVMCFL